MHLLVSNKCLCECQYLQVHVLIYTVVVQPTGICTELLLVANNTIVDVLVVYTHIRYYTHNIPLLANKTEYLNISHDVNNMVITMNKNDDAY